MKYLLTIVCSVLVLGLAAQTDPYAPFQKDKNLPAFKIVSVGGKEITHKNLPKYKYQMIIIFSPDCPHCEHEAAEINKYADKFKNVLMIWDSYKDMPSIRKFAEKYNLPFTLLSDPSKIAIKAYGASSVVFTKRIS